MFNLEQSIKNQSIMENNTLSLDNHLTPTVKYKGRYYKVQSDKSGFRYIKVSENGKRVIIPIKDEPKDEVFYYIFNYGFRDNPNERLSQLAKERIYKKIQ